MLHRSGEERGPSELQVTNPLPDPLAGLLLARGLTLEREQTLLGHEHTIALDVAIGQAEAVDHDRDQGIEMCRMLCRECLEAGVEALNRLIHDLEQAVLF